METQQIQNLTLLRAAVGLLGEHAQPPWWSSTFCGSNGRAFLSPVFPRTYVLAQCQGVSSAAAIVHDDRIGVGNVFHLFRLPEDVEQSLHTMLSGDELTAITEVMQSVDAATDYLKSCAGNSPEQPVGPVRVGGLDALRSAAAWHDVAAIYLAGFGQQKETFPFFRDRT